MINLLIADNNFSSCKNLINYVLSNSSNMNLVAIATTVKEIIDVLQFSFIDFLILNLMIPSTEKLKILSYIQSHSKNRSLKIILIPEDRRSLLNNDKLVSLIFEKIENSISNSYIIPIDRIKLQIIQELEFIGFNFKHIGTTYLLESILLCFETNQIMPLPILEKSIYKMLSIKYDKSIFNIKNNIIKAINYMYVENDCNKIQKYFKLVIDIKPTPKFIIATIISKITNI